jgi:hypothetical protein
MDSFQFSTACRALSSAARAAGLLAPSFRSPPGVEGATRTIRRRSRSSVVLAVAIHGRPTEAVLSDLVEGVVVANGLEPKDALRVRGLLWEAVTGSQAGAAA